MTGSIGSGMKPSGARPQRSSKQPKRNIPVLENYVRTATKHCINHQLGRCLPRWLLSLSLSLNLV